MKSPVLVCDVGIGDGEIVVVVVMKEGMVVVVIRLVVSIDEPVLDDNVVGDGQFVLIIWLKLQLISSIWISFGLSNNLR